MARKMKDSGVEWIGMIPDGWNVVPAKLAFDEVQNVNKDGAVQKALKFKFGSIIPKTNFDSDDEYVAGTITNYTIVNDGDIIVNGLNLNYDLKSLRVGLVREKGVITSAYLALRPRTQQISSVFATYLLKGYETRMALHNMGYGIRKTLGFKEFKTQPILLPSLAEQNRIAGHLDAKCAAIDDVIAKTNESIEEYKKLKQAVITEAVTKGVRGKRPMKDSGIDWIGQIPKDWDLKRFRYVADSFEKGSGITKDEVVPNGDTPCVRYGEIYSKYSQSFTECFSKTNKGMLPNLQYFSNGDILFTCTGELVEEIGKSIVYLGKEECLAGGDIIIAKHRQNPSFLNYALNSSYLQTQKSCGKTKLKVVHISAQELKNLIVFLPSLEEQREIADYLDKKCAAIDSLIEKKQQFIDELTAYKKSLIYEYVTGKKEVPA